MKSWPAAIAAVLAILAAPVEAETVTGRVVGITDGDTLTLLDARRQQRKIRLIGIDAPEKAQPFGERSKTSLSALAFDQEAIAECTGKKHRDREICAVFVQGKDVGLEQVAAGLAWWYRKYASEQTPEARADYEAAEFMAKARRLGLWSDKNPVPPWDWRRAMREE